MTANQRTTRCNRFPAPPHLHYFHCIQYNHCFLDDIFLPHCAGLLVASWRNCHGRFCPVQSYDFSSRNSGILFSSWCINWLNLWCCISMQRDPCFCKAWSSTSVPFVCHHCAVQCCETQKSDPCSPLFLLSPPPGKGCADRHFSSLWGCGCGRRLFLVAPGSLLCCVMQNDKCENPIGASFSISLLPSSLHQSSLER